MTLQWLLSRIAPDRPRLGETVVAADALAIARPMLAGNRFRYHETDKPKVLHAAFRLKHVVCPVTFQLAPPGQNSLVILAGAGVFIAEARRLLIADPGTHQFNARAWLL